MSQITVKTIVNSPLEKVWECWTKPEHITRWTFASDDWEAPSAENDVRVGGTFKTRMAAKDKSAAFDFGGTYTAVKEHELLEYDMGDSRHVRVEFKQLPEGSPTREATAEHSVEVTEIFDPENENPTEMQRAGWQAILDNFKKYTESNG